MGEEKRSKSEPRYCVKDARGRSVTLLDPYALHLLRRHDLIPPQPLHEIAEEVGPGVKKRRYLLFWACPVCAFLFFVIVVIRKLVIGTGIHFDTVERVLWPLNLILLLVAGVMMWRSSREARFRRVRNVMLRHLRCPRCGYDIRGLPKAPKDGATVCPECGSAWRLDDATTAELPAETTCGQEEDA